MRLHRTVWMAFLGSAVGFGAAARGQTRAMPPDPYDPQQSAVARNTSPAAPAAQPAPATDNVTDYPAAEVQAVPVAMAHATHDQAVFDLTVKNLGRVADQLKEDFELSSQTLTAMRGQKLAYDRYSAARQRVLATLQSETEYQALVKLRDDLGETLVELHKNPTANAARIDAAAAVKLQYATKLSAMESDALLADKTVQDTKAQFLDASDRVADLRAEFARSMPRDPTFVAARNQVEEARIDRTTSQALLEGAVQARDIAMNYAYDLHRYDQYQYLSAGGLGYPYNTYGYFNGGYGLGYPYPGPQSAYNGYWRR